MASFIFRLRQNGSYEEKKHMIKSPSNLFLNSNSCDLFSLLTGLQQIN